jgi:hypothetical protein
MLHYTVSPGTVAYSTADRHSVAALTIVATNRGDTAVACPRLRFWLPNDPIAHQSTLTTDPSTVTVDVGGATPWAIWTSGDGVCFAVPLPPATGIAPGASAEFRFAGILVNTVPGRVPVEIREPDGTTAAVTVEKVPPSAASASTAVAGSAASPR